MAGAETVITPSVERRIDQLTQALRLMIETQGTHGEMLARLIELATPSDEESPLEVSMAEIAGALRDQTVVLERIGATMEGLGTEVESGVMRGLATAFEAGDQVEAQGSVPGAPGGAAG